MSGAPRSARIPAPTGMPGPQSLDFEGPAPVRPASVIRATHARRDSITRRALLVGDLLSVEAALLVAGLLGGVRTDGTALGWYGLPMLLVFALLFKVYGLYDRDIKRISHTGIDDLPYVFHALIIGTLALWAYMKAIPEQQMLFDEIAWFGGVALTLIIVSRSLTRRGINRVLGGENVLIAASGATCELIARKLHAHPEYGQRPKAILVPFRDGEIPPAAAAIAEPWIGGPTELERMIATGGFDRVMVARDDYSSEEVFEMMDLCRRYAVKVGVLPGVSDSFGPSLELDEVEGITVLGVNPPVLGRASAAMKRGLDLLFAVPALVAFALLMALIAVAIRLDSPGPALFRQRRVGKGGEHFTLLKFRTMRADAEDLRGELMQHSLSPNWLHLDDDPRITRLGGFLRRTSLDELPQLINVLRGEMSLVGPRPLPVSEDAFVKGWGRGRLDLTPGITGLWQVLGRTSIPFEEMVKLDYIYVANWSLWMDIRLFLRTLPAVLRRRGVN